MKSRDSQSWWKNFHKNWITKSDRNQ